MWCFRVETQLNEIDIRACLALRHHFFHSFLIQIHIGKTVSFGFQVLLWNFSQHELYFNLANKIYYINLLSKYRCACVAYIGTRFVERQLHGFDMRYFQNVERNQWQAATAVVVVVQR